jgi:exonuclease III
MKLITYNVKALGSWEKITDVLKMVKQQRHMVICIQETKLNIINDYVCPAIWGLKGVRFLL